MESAAAAARLAMQNLWVAGTRPAMTILLGNDSL
jgi:hypothetical protein